MIAARRLAAQRIARPSDTRAADVVVAFGALQAQDYAAVKWAVGLRLARASSDAEIERAVDEGALVRTHAFRGTWQLIARADVRWMLALVAPRMIKSHATAYRTFGLDEKSLARSQRALAKALRDGASLTRAEVMRVLADAGVPAHGTRLAYLMLRAELDAVVCNGPRRGKQSTWALFDARVPAASGKHRPRSRQEALAELARRYFATRGPATVDDFNWWSGVGAAEARAAVAYISQEVSADVVDGRTLWRAAAAPRPVAESSAHLLPAFDEYLVAYRHRGAVLDDKHAKRVNAGGGMLGPCVVIDGRIVGTWRRTLARATVTIAFDYFLSLSRNQRRAIELAARRYADFLGLELRLV